MECDPGIESDGPSGKDDEGWKWEKTGEAAWAANQDISSEEDEEGFAKPKLGSRFGGEVKFMDAIGVELGKLLRERFDVRRLAMESMELATGDVKRACRLVKVARQDCGLQACKTGARGGERLWLNKVGAFGVSSAAYHWSRLMPGLGRLVYYMWGRAEMAMLVFVDDLFWLTREKGGMEKILGSIFFMVILGLPFSRKKFCGGLQLSWAGFIHIGFERWVAGAFGSQICLDSQWRWVQCTVRIADRWQLQWVLGLLAMEGSKAQVCLFGLALAREAKAQMCVLRGGLRKLGLSDSLPKALVEACKTQTSTVEAVLSSERLIGEELDGDVFVWGAEQGASWCKRREIRGGSLRRRLEEAQKEVEGSLLYMAELSKATKRPHHLTGEPCRTLTLRDVKDLQLPPLGDHEGLELPMWDRGHSFVGGRGVGSCLHVDQAWWSNIAKNYTGYKLVAVWSNCDVLQLKGQLFRRPLSKEQTDALRKVGLRRMENCLCESFTGIVRAHCQRLEYQLFCHFGMDISSIRLQRLRCWALEMWQGGTAEKAYVEAVGKLESSGVETVMVLGLHLRLKLWISRILLQLPRSGTPSASSLSWLEFLASQRSEQLSWRLQRAFDERVECLESESPLAVSYVEMMHREYSLLAELEESSSGFDDTLPVLQIAQVVPPRVLIIAGSDSGGGAGLQADLKSCAALGAFSTTAITALTAQNTHGVQGIFPVPIDFLRQQIDSVLSDLGTDVVKTGMLATSEIVQAVADALKVARGASLVVDPVMVSTSGHTLLQEDAIQSLKEEVFPHATIITPNLPEACLLLGLKEIKTVASMEEAARQLTALGPRWVLVKGGHLQESVEEATDILCSKSSGECIHFNSKMIPKTSHTHGTGCTLASSIAAFLAKGLPVPDAVKAAKDFVSGAIAASAHLTLGSGTQGPMNHSWAHFVW
ncbi:Thiamine biosynthetic bifunctional enzyme TH1 [Durusdinium trenchii]|uniref:Chloroplastic n=1 Tax=Durusdinium trenchii TaxID=1381693 RepID=A0ABP0P348_9DINO